VDWSCGFLKGDNMNTMVVFSFYLAGILALGAQHLQAVSQVSTISQYQSLDKRIPIADPQKYKGIRDAQNWLNPILTIQADGIRVDGKGFSKVVAPEDLRRALVPIKYNHRMTEELLKELGVKVEWWPSA
jgi:hypothetical protein